MASGKKEYIVKINGLDTSLKDVTALEKAVLSLDKTVKSTNAAINVAAKASTSKAKALTDEEKAAKRLADTQKRLNEVGSEANRAQIEANQQLRERTREVTREIALNNLAEGSIKAMGMQLTDLRNNYESLSAEERVNAEIGGKMLEQIQALDAEYKALRESTGNFRDSVGNYEKAIGGLNKLDSALGEVNDTSLGLASSVLGNTQLFSVFGDVAAGTSKIQSELAKIIALVTVVQQVNTAITKEGAVATAASAAVDGIKTAQLKAKTIAEGLATKSTIAATAAQAVFNAVAYANPYVLLAMAIVAVVGALAYFIDSTEDSTDAQKELNDQQRIWLDYLDSEAERLKLVSNSRVSAMERQIKLLNAQGNKTKEIRKIEDDINRERVLNNARLLGMYSEEVESLEKNRAKMAQYYDLLRTIQLAQASGKSKLTLDIDLNGKAKEVKVEDAINIVQSRIDNLGKSVKIAVDLKTEQADLANQQKVLQAQRAAEDKAAAEKAAEEAKRRAEEAKQKAAEARRAALERAALELEAQRAAEDLRLKLLGESLEAQRRIISVDYKRQIEDLKLRLKNESNLTINARKAINDQIVNLTKVRDLELAKLDKEIAAQNLETRRQLEDQQTALIEGQLARRSAEIKLTYDRQIEDVKKRLEDEKTLTEQQRQDLNEMLINYEAQKNREIEALTVEGLTRRTALELSILEGQFKAAQNKIGEITKYQKGGVWAGVIDVEATRENLKASKAALDEYVANLSNYLETLEATHATTIAGLKEGTVEYEEELQKYAQATEDANQKIREAQKAQAENTKASNELQIEAFKGMAEKVAEYADLAAQAITSVFDTWSMGLQASLDTLNEQLDTINDHYEEAQAKRNKYAEDVVAIEEKIQNATGGTADALREQLQSAMHQREEAAREEDRLAREKEKKEAEIRKKEKQLKRNELVTGIAQGIANTAQGVTKALTLMWPLNLVMAGVVGAMGAAQVGVMTKQLTKLAEGGEIVGPSHANGGVNIGLGYEAEGGEFVTNKVSYAANAPLVRFINDTDRTVTAADLVGLVPGMDGAPMVIGQAGSSGEDRIIEALENIDFNPTVAVTDIIDVTNEVVTVRDLSGF